MHPPRKLRLTASVLLCFVLQSLGADNYNNNNGQTYEFGFKIDGQQHRHESKDKDGIIMGEFGFVTADDVYHVTVYATDKEGRFKILSMKNINLKTSPASMPGGPLSSRQGHALALPATPPVSGQASIVPQALPASSEKPTGSCASCLKIPDTTPPPYNNNNQNQFGVPGTGPQNKQVFTPSPHPHGPQNSSPGGPSDSSNNGPAFPLPPYGQQNTSPGGPSVSSNIEPPFPPSPFGQQNTSPGGPSFSSNGGPAFPPSPFGQQNTSPGGPSVSSNGGPAFPPSPFGQQNASPGGPSVSSNGGPAFPSSPFGQQNASPGGPSVSSNGGPAFPPSPFGLQNTSPGGPSVSSNGEPAFFPSPYGQQNPSLGGPNVSSNNKHTGERTAKQFNDLSKQFDSQLGPNGSRGQVVGPNQGGPAKPTLVTAQLQIVDKNTDVYALGPNEMKGLPPGLSQDDITTLLYTFNYTVGFHGHFEEGYTNGVKKGYYFVTGRNGVRTRIDYIADDTGFHPTVTNDVLDLLSEDVPKPETEKDEKYGLKGYEFKWLFYPVESKAH